MALEPIQGALERAIEAAETLGLETAEAQVVARTIEERQGYPSDLYVLALAGGTGVGKSSLLNAIAGDDVSPAGARRPTTTSPVALLPAGHRAEAAPLLEWLGGAEVRTRAGEGPAVAIVDLPDLDSIEPAHAARVDAILPRIDAVLWVTDPEKYDDAVLHDRYLPRWMPRLVRQAFVVNKADRLPPDDVQRICDDLRGRLRREALPEVPVLGVSAIADVEPLREWLLEGVSAKAIVTARLQQGASEAARELASAAGIDGPAAPGPLIATEAQAEAAAATGDAILDLVGQGGLRAQSEAAVWDEARAAGGGPIQRFRQVLERGSGAATQRADPEGYLRRWRERGSLDRALAPIRQLTLAAAGAVPARLRPSVLATADPTAISEQLSQGIDAAVSSPALVGDRPRSGTWRAIGLLQLAATAALLVGIIWLVVLLAAAGSTPTGTIDLPLLGPMPTPAVLIVGGLLATFLLDRLLRWQAGRLGRAWADRVLADIARRVSDIVTDVLAGQLASVDEARYALWAAARDIEPAPATARQTMP
ncbi:MAG: GTPase domain-containing protein [Chloroflexota bacterium]|jgi:hypothetical protein